MCSETESAKKKRITTGIFRVWIAICLGLWGLFTIFSILLPFIVPEYKHGWSAIDILSMMFPTVVCVIAIVLGYAIIRLVVATWFWIVEGFRGK